MSLTDLGNGLMTGNDDTGNPARLPLTDRARRGLLAGEPRLPLSELVELEHPAGGEARQSIKTALRAAIAYGDLEAREQERITLQPALSGRIEEPWTFRPRPVRTVEPFIERESYRAWRAQCPASLLSPLSQVSKWLGAPTLPQGEPALLPQGTVGTQNPAMNRQCVSDKARFLGKAKWEGTQQATVNQHPEAAYFKGKYDTPTLLDWASEIDPRPKDQRGGRPRKSSR